MRLRLAVLATLVTTLAAVAVSSVASAAPRHNRGLTINAIPNPIDAGEGVFIYGQLNAGPVAGQTIILYHHLAGSGRGYTKVGQTTTDSHGFYEFTRAEDVVETNRSWFTREAGAHPIHSRTVFERVAALVSLTASTSTADTSQPVTFTGSVTPNHGGERVLLQQQNDAGTAWRTLKSGRLDGGSNYSITYRWRFAGDHVVRVLFPRDARNISGTANPVTEVIQQKQIPGFSINTSDQLISYGQSVTISGVLDEPSSTTTAGAERYAGHPVGEERLPEPVHPGRRYDHRFGWQLQLRPPDADQQHRVPGSDHPGSAPSQRGAVRGRPGRGLDDTELDHQ